MPRRGCIAETWLHCRDVVTLLHYRDVAALLHYRDVAALLHYRDMAALLHFQDVAALLKRQDWVHVRMPRRGCATKTSRHGNIAETNLSYFCVVESKP